MAADGGTRTSLGGGQFPKLLSRAEPTCLKNIMDRIIEADFFPPPVEETKEKPRILIIDNNRDFTHSAKLGLEGTGRYSVWEENKPARAHQTAQRVEPDLILLDIAMPETDGGDVAENTNCLSHGP